MLFCCKHHRQTTQKRVVLKQFLEKTKVDALLVLQAVALTSKQHWFFDWSFSSQKSVFCNL